MVSKDYQYALKPDNELALTLENCGQDQWQLPVLGPSFVGDQSGDTWLLQLTYQSTHKKKLGEISIVSEGKEKGAEGTQYFEANQQGVRYLNLTGCSFEQAMRLHTEHCEIKPQVRLLGFKSPDFSDGPILILAPHADDAELAAYGFYRHWSAQTWIVTINAGQSLPKLDRQYIRRLDDQLGDAAIHKAQIRAWNSVTTPLLAGVDQQRLINLGYFDLTTPLLYQRPDEAQTNAQAPDLSPQVARRWNPLALPSDDQNISSGAALIDDLAYLLEHIKPSTVLVTEPEIDPHAEHEMTAHALALAMKKSQHRVERVLMYVNHLHQTKAFPYGPEHARTALPPWFDPDSVLGAYQCYSFGLSDSVQKEKVMAFDTMHDLRSKPRWEKTFKQWWSRKVKKSGYRFYADHAYFQTHIKADEVFTWVNAQHFSECLTRSQGASLLS